MSEETQMPVKKDTAYLLYFMHIAGAFTFTMTGFLGLIWAYIERKNAKKSQLLMSHYTFLINTYWKGLLIFVLGALTLVFAVGVLIWIFWFAWTLVRLIKGFRTLRAGEIIEKPARWGF